MLDYINTKNDCNIISDFTISGFISDQRVLYASLQCIRSYPVRKQVAVRPLWQIKDDALDEDLDKLNTDQGCVDVDRMIEQYDKFLSDLLGKHVLKKNGYVIGKPLNEWMADKIHAVKTIHCKNLLIWRKTRSTLNS